MKKFGQRKMVVGLIGVAAVFFLIITGCASMKGEKKSSGSSAAAQKRGPAPVYYDFEDVLIPKELKLIDKQSFVQKISDFSAGVLSFKGRVEKKSLINFFNNNMVKDNWKPIVSFKSVRSVLLFNKMNRRCIISISEDVYYTYIEIWVAPTISGVDSGLIK